MRSAVDSGSISLLGRNAGSPSSRKNVGFCLDGDGLYQSLDSSQNLEFFKIAYGVSHPAHRYARLLGVDDFGKKPVSQYSRGMNKRLALARALMCSPQLLLLDEPLLGLDPDGQHELIEVLRQISDGRAVLISSHDLSAVESMCDRIVVLKQRVLFDGYLEQFRVRGASMYAAYRSIVAGLATSLMSLKFWQERAQATLDTLLALPASARHIFLAKTSFSSAVGVVLSVIAVTFGACNIVGYVMWSLSEQAAKVAQLGMLVVLGAGFAAAFGGGLSIATLIVIATAIFSIGVLCVIAVNTERIILNLD